MNETELKTALDSITNHWPDIQPAAGLILGSGWNEVLEAFEVADVISYAEIPGLGSTGVKGHAGRLVRISHCGRDVLVFQGRRHWYEGTGWTPIAMPVYILKQLGAETLLLTNAAGGINRDFEAGDFMVISDHINLMGNNPLIGQHLSVFGDRFPDMSCIYDRAIREHMKATAASDSQEVHEGIYLAASGPSYETPAEILAFRSLGADAVGMSTVPEALLARAAGMRVGGLSCITNMAAGVSESELHHDEVVEIAAKVMPRMRNLLAGTLQRILEA